MATLTPISNSYEPGLFLLLNQCVLITSLSIYYRAISFEHNSFSTSSCTTSIRSSIHRNSAKDVFIHTKPDNPTYNGHGHLVFDEPPSHPDVQSRMVQMATSTTKTSRPRSDLGTHKPGYSQGSGSYTDATKFAITRRDGGRRQRKQLSLQTCVGHV